MALKNSGIASANPASIANKNYINALYVERFGRNATQAELNRFATSTVKDAANVILGASLSPFTNNVAKPSVPVPIPNPSVIKDYNVTGTSQDGKTLYGIPKNVTPVIPEPNQPTQQKAEDKNTGTSGTPGKEKTASELATEQQTAADKKQADEINAYIDSLGLDESHKMILRQVAKESFSSGLKTYTPQDVDKLLETAAKNAETDINPYYSTLQSRDIEDLKNKMADIRNTSALYNQNEQKSYAERLKETKDSLRARGLTFSGENTRQLGQSGSLVNNQEGLVPQQRRYDVETKTNDFETLARDTGLEAERKLGSATLNNVQGELGSIADPYKGGTTYTQGMTTPLYQVNQAGTPGYVETGDRELQRLKDIETRKWSNIGALKQTQ